LSVTPGAIRARIADLAWPLHAFETIRPTFLQENLTMLRLAVIFLIVALVAAFLGFGGVASLSFEGAKILFVIFLILAVLSFLGHGYRRGSFWN
jgi:uncharacterized membrane protein YtjA (UPF0391 family)